MITYTEAEILKSPYTNYVQIPYNELHNHTFWEIFLILTGQCTHTVNGVSYDLTAGTVCFLRPIKDKHFFPYHRIVPPYEFKKTVAVFGTGQYTCHHDMVFNACVLKAFANILKNDVLHVGLLRLFPRIWQHSKIVDIWIQRHFLVARNTANHISP